MITDLSVVGFSKYIDNRDEGREAEEDAEYDGSTTEWESGIVRTAVALTYFFTSPFTAFSSTITHAGARFSTSFSNINHF